MKRDQLIKILKELVAKSKIYEETPFKVDGDPSDWHELADKSILEYINDKEISELFYEIERWYA
jgi:hypothetical protein